MLLGTTLIVFSSFRSTTLSRSFCEAWLPLSRPTQWREAPSTVLFLHMTFPLWRSDEKRSGYITYGEPRWRLKVHVESGCRTKPQRAQAVGSLVLLESKIGRERIRTPSNSVMVFNILWGRLMRPRQNVRRPAIP